MTGPKAKMVSSREAEIASLLKAEITLLEAEPIREKVSSPKAKQPQFTNKEYIIPLDPRSGDVPPSRVMNCDCNSCASYDEGWCWHAAKRTFYNIKFLEACPLAVSPPEIVHFPKADKLDCDCSSCDSYHNGWCRAVPGKPFYNIKFLRACPLENSECEALVVE